MGRFSRSAWAVCLGSAIWLTGSTGLYAVGGSQQAPPDNTKTNQRDKKSAEPTAGQQKDNVTDRELTQKIRRSITQDKSLSTYAHNVKIISQNGMVTLRGPVRSEEEKKAIDAKANEIAGNTHVKNELEIAPEKPSSKTQPSKDSH